MSHERTEAPDNTAVRVALWRAMVQAFGLFMTAPGEVGRMSASTCSTVAPRLAAQQENALLDMPLRASSLPYDASATRRCATMPRPRLPSPSDA
jgi:hypothetical protein